MNDLLDLKNKKLKHNNPKLNIESNEVDFKEYKQLIDKYFEEQKHELEQQYLTLNSNNNNNNNEEDEDEEEIKKELEKEFNRKKQDLENEFEDKKENQLNELNNIYNRKNKEQLSLLNRNKDKSSQIQLKESEIKQLENEIIKLKLTLNELKENEINNEDYSNQYADEIKKIELSYETKLNNYQTQLEIDLNNKKQKLKNQFLNKRLEYETQLKKQESKPTDNNILKEKKDLILSNHNSRLEQYKESLISHYQNNVDIEKEKILLQNNQDVNQLKESFEKTKAIYDSQKMVFNTEQNLIYANSFVSKIKNINENKNSIFKNLIDYAYYYLKKKLKEIENDESIMSLNNKDDIMNKIAESLIYILYENLYDYLINDLVADKEMLSNSLDEIVNNIESVIGSFSFENKIQLSMLICNPNLNN